MLNVLAGDLVAAGYAVCPGSYIGGLWPPRLVGSMRIIVLRLLGQNLPKMLFAVEQQVFEALAP